MVALAMALGALVHIRYGDVARAEPRAPRVAEDVAELGGVAEPVRVKVPLARDRDAQPLLGALAGAREERAHLRRGAGGRVERVRRRVAVAHRNDRGEGFGRGRRLRHHPRGEELRRRHGEQRRAVGSLRRRELELAERLPGPRGPRFGDHRRGAVTLAEVYANANASSRERWRKALSARVRPRKA